MPGCWSGPGFSEEMADEPLLLQPCHFDQWPTHVTSCVPSWYWVRLFTNRQQSLGFRALVRSFPGFQGFGLTPERIYLGHSMIPEETARIRPVSGGESQCFAAGGFIAVNVSELEINSSGAVAEKIQIRYNLMRSGKGIGAGIQAAWSGAGPRWEPAGAEQVRNPDGGLLSGHRPGSDLLPEVEGEKYDS